MAAFTREALASYFPGACSRSSRSALSRWATGGERPLLPGAEAPRHRGHLRQRARHGAGSGAGEARRRLRHPLQGFHRACPSICPASSFHAALKARDRILAQLAEQVRRHQAGVFDDGLSRVLRGAHRRRQGNGAGADATKEMHHVVLAGTIVFAELGAMLLELSRHPAVREKLVAEVKAGSPRGPGRRRPQLRQMPYLDQVVMEVKRTCPNVPVASAVPGCAILIGDVTIPAGWNVMMALGAHNMNRHLHRAGEVRPRRFGELARRADAGTRTRSRRRAPARCSPVTSARATTTPRCSCSSSRCSSRADTRGRCRRRIFSVNRALVPPELKSGLRVAIRKA